MKRTTLTGLITAITLLFATNAFAALEFFNSSDVNLGTVASAKCSTGLTCAITSGKLVMSSSPTLTSALSLKAADATAATLTLQADNSDDSGDDYQIQVTTGDLLTFSNDTSGSQVVKMTMNTSGDLFGIGTGKLYGFINDEVQATATTITAAQCGKTFYNAGAVQMELPAGSAGLIGCRLTFITANASNFDLNPGNSDQILVLTNAAGDAVRNATLGNTLVIQYGATNQWYEISAVGTWSDIN